MVGIFSQSKITWTASHLPQDGILPTSNTSKGLDKILEKPEELPEKIYDVLVDVRGRHITTASILADETYKDLDAISKTVANSMAVNSFSSFVSSSQKNLKATLNGEKPLGDAVGTVVGDVSEAVVVGGAAYFGHHLAISTLMELGLSQNWMKPLGVAAGLLSARLCKHLYTQSGRHERLVQETSQFVNTGRLNLKHI